MRIGFYVLGPKGYSALNSFIAAWGSARVAFVVAAHDNGVENDWFLELRALCGGQGIHFRERNTANSSSFPEADFCFAIGWRWMIPNDGRPLVVLHDSLLPRYRGFAPLVNMLIAGEERIGVTALLATTEYDRGEIISQMAKTISYPLKISDAIRIVSPLYGELVRSVSEQLFTTGRIVTVPQDERIASYSMWRDEEDYLIDWHDDAEQIKRFVHAVGSPYRGAAAFLAQELVRINDVQVEPDVLIEGRRKAVGKVIFMRQQHPVIVCGTGLIRITEIRTDSGEDLLGRIPFRSRFKSSKYV